MFQDLLTGLLIALPLIAIALVVKAIEKVPGKIRTWLRWALVVIPIVVLVYVYWRLINLDS
jgi:hypothetical protein